jgi:hypothetical protein
MEYVFKNSDQVVKYIQFRNTQHYQASILPLHPNNTASIDCTLPHILHVVKV